jgi:hypothetical protein
MPAPDDRQRILAAVDDAGVVAVQPQQNAERVGGVAFVVDRLLAQRWPGEDDLYLVRVDGLRLVRVPERD